MSDAGAVGEAEGGDELSEKQIRNRWCRYRSRPSVSSRARLVIERRVLVARTEMERDNDILSQGRNKIQVAGFL